MNIFSNNTSSLCLRCASPSSLAGTPISSLPSLPSCSPSSLPPDYNRQSGTSSSSLAPPPSLTVVGVGTLVVVIFIAASLTVNIYYVIAFLIITRNFIHQVVKYRHYGVYRTGEAADREQEVLTNPVTVLDR